MKFQYAVCRYPDRIYVEIRFTKLSKSYMQHLGMLHFNDPDEYQEQFELWKASMQWNPLHELIDPESEK